ncbi:site-specific integrase [Lichenihabitans sp. Uapishka_5]|uniref:tyrosine-type recombinase/integrase n=1 Tax=Lichenihabitans sp. Uapishka_5 TaxID=3037302 RepID=UPI0029E8068C|nr:site-specific integrase [Lichenihabitans sp. Uapishka_5]MDX7951626.1 site-specific integrase [Lichenihabitans sp. Uapishka_5]
MVAFIDGAQRRAKPIKASTASHYAQMLAGPVTWFERRGFDRIAHLTTENLTAYVREAKRRTPDIQIRRQLTALASLVRYVTGSSDFEGKPDPNAVRLVPKEDLADVTDRPRSIERDELDRVLSAAATHRDPFWRRFVLLVAGTGMRHEEALGLEWGEVDLDGRRIRLRPERVKTGVGRTIPLSSVVFEAIGAVPRAPDGHHVFVNPDTGQRYVNVQKGWRGIRKRAGLPKLRLHDLRHTFQHLARDSGMSEEDRMTIAGHSSEVVHRQYAKGGTAGLQEEMEKHSPLAGGKRRTYKNTVTTQEPKSSPPKRRKKPES